MLSWKYRMQFRHIGHAWNTMSMATLAAKNSLAECTAASEEVQRLCSHRGTLVGYVGAAMTTRGCLMCGTVFDDSTGYVDKYVDAMASMPLALEVNSKEIPCGGDYSEWCRTIHDLIKRMPEVPPPEEMELSPEAAVNKNLS